MAAAVQGFAQGALASMRAAAAAAETQNRVSTNGVLPVDKGAVRKSKHDCGEYRQGRQWRSKDFVEAPLLDSVVAQYGVNTEAFVPAYWRAGPLVYGQEERSALSTTLEIGCFILDTADAGLDIQFVGQLLGSGHVGYAGFLTATTVTGFLANVFFVRPFMRWHPHPRENSPAVTLLFIGAEIFLCKSGRCPFRTRQQRGTWTPHTSLTYTFNPCVHHAPRAGLACSLCGGCHDNVHLEQDLHLQ